MRQMHGMMGCVGYLKRVCPEHIAGKIRCVWGKVGTGTIARHGHDIAKHAGSEGQLPERHQHLHRRERLFQPPMGSEPSVLPPLSISESSSRSSAMTKHPSGRKEANKHAGAQGAGLHESASSLPQPCKASSLKHF